MRVLRGDEGTRRRIRLVFIAAAAIVAGAAAVAPFLWIFGFLDEIEWRDDFITGVLVAVAIYMAVAAGFVMARPRALVAVWAATLVWIFVESLRWEDTPGLSGIDDMPPTAGLPFSWFVMAFPAIGLLLADRLDRS